MNTDHDCEFEWIPARVPDADLTILHAPTGVEVIVPSQGTVNGTLHVARGIMARLGDFLEPLGLTAPGDCASLSG
ncbi:MAG TPA: hypothetical protein PLL15_10320 [Syntrophales bacterium]|nr:hypothetical protein [Syntrophales bacterium]